MYSVTVTGLSGAPNGLRGDRSAIGKLAGEKATKPGQLPSGTVIARSPTAGTQLRFSAVLRRQ